MNNITYSGAASLLFQIGHNSPPFPLSPLFPPLAPFILPLPSPSLGLYPLNPVKGYEGAL